MLHQLLYRTVSIAALMAGTLSGARSLASGETQALAFDFTDNAWLATTNHYGSAYVLDTGTPANNYDSHPYGLLTYTSPPAKMTLGPSGALRFGAHNLYLNSASPANQSITVVSGATYSVDITGSVSVTASGAATGTWTSGSNTFTAATTTLTLGSTSGSGTVVVRRTPSDSTYLATTSAARYALPFEWDSSGNLLGLLVEEARTNLATYSESFDNVVWSEQSIDTIVSGSTNAPDGLSSAEVLVATSGTAAHIVYRMHVLLSGTKYAWSIYVKKNTHRYVAIALEGDVANNYATAVFDLDGGGVVATQTGVGSSSGTIETTSQTNIGNGWYRLVLVASINSVTVYPWIGLAGAATGNTLSSTGEISVSATGTESVYLWGAQLEAGSFATSYTPTFGATVTRAADQLSLATSLFSHSATVNSAMVEYVPCDVATATPALRWDDGTSNERVDLGHNASAAPALSVTDGGAAQTAPLTSGTLTVNVAKKLAAKWKANDFILSNAGATAATDNSGTLPTVTSLKLGAAGVVRIKKLLITPADKNSSQIEALAA